MSYRVVFSPEAEEQLTALYIRSNLAMRRK
jgi:hypothetical protein